jgi:uncharacterized protein (TIGR02271 family)
MDHTETSAENPIIVGFFDNQVRAERALHDLREAGFTSASIGFAHRATRPASSHTANPTNEAERTWEKVKSFFQGQAENSTEQRTQAAAATTELSDSSTSTTSGYSNDDLDSSLIDMGLSEPRARYFGRRLQSTGYGAVITVNASDRPNVAEFILRDNGADLGENASDLSDFGGPTVEYTEQQPDPQPTHIEPPAKAQSAATAQPVVESDDQYLCRRDTNVGNEPSRTITEIGDMQNIQLLGEVLRVHKEKINRGEVTVRKDVVTETKTIQVPVKREELVIEQRPAAGDTQAPGQQIRIPLSEETASVGKRTVVREEVAVGRKPVQEIQDMTGEVKHEELVVDDRTKRAVNE